MSTVMNKLKKKLSRCIQRTHRKKKMNVGNPDDTDSDDDDDEGEDPGHLHLRNVIYRQSDFLFHMNNTLWVLCVVVGLAVICLLATAFQREPPPPPPCECPCPYKSMVEFAFGHRDRFYAQCYKEPWYVSAEESLLARFKDLDRRYDIFNQEMAAYYRKLGFGPDGELNHTDVKSTCEPRE